jgi:hypothetical protein
VQYTSGEGLGGGTLMTGWRGRRYKNHRLLALYFDMSAMRPADQLSALSAAERFLRTQMTTVDLVAILRYQGGSVDILQDLPAIATRC